MATGDGIADPERVNAIWEAQLDSFLEAFFDGEPTPEATEACTARANSWLMSHERHSRTTPGELYATLRLRGVFDPVLDGELAIAASTYCLQAGADHVLVGMRRRDYVRELSPLLSVGYTSSFTPR